MCSKCRVLFSKEEETRINSWRDCCARLKYTSAMSVLHNGSTCPNPPIILSIFIHKLLEWSYHRQAHRGNRKTCLLELLRCIWLIYNVTLLYKLWLSWAAGGVIDRWRECVVWGCRSSSSWQLADCWLQSYVKCLWHR